MADTVLVHPNRDKASSKASRSIVVLLLLVSAGLILIVTVGGWSISRARRGCPSPTSSCTWRWPSSWPAGTVACSPWPPLWRSSSPSSPRWPGRRGSTATRPASTTPPLDPALLGLLTLILIPVQLLLTAFAMQAFQQQWNVEVEVTEDEANRYHDGGLSAGELRPLQP